MTEETDQLAAKLAVMDNELHHLRAQLLGHHQENRATLLEIRDQTRKTNGRVDVLEDRAGGIEEQIKIAKAVSDDRRDTRHGAAEWVKWVIALMAAPVLAVLMRKFGF